MSGVEVVLVDGPEDGRTMVIPLALFESGVIAIPPRLNRSFAFDAADVPGPATTARPLLYRATGDITAAGDYVFALEGAQADRQYMRAVRDRVQREFPGLLDGDS